MQKLLIIISRTEKTQRTAHRIKNAVQKHTLICEIIFLEDVIINNYTKSSSQKNSTVVFFLTNHHRIGLYVEYFISQGYIIINQQFLQGERSKLFIQDRITKHNISTPSNELLTSQERAMKFINKTQLPVYIKSQNQMHTVLYIKDYTNLKKTVTRLQNTIGEWYIEKAYTGNRHTLNKVYFVFGKIYTDKKINTSLTFTHTLANSLGLDVFSADVITSLNKKYWVIDVNPAPGFYAHSMARKTFAKHLSHINIT